jgi:hypothetical protein
MARSEPARRRAARPSWRGAGGSSGSAAGSGVAIESDVLVEEDRIGVGDCGGEQRPGVLRGRGHDDLQPRRAVEPGLGVLGVVRPGLAQPAPRHPDDHRHRGAPPVADLGRVVDELVEPGGDEVVELHLADRPEAAQGGAHTGAEHGALGERRVEDPVAETLGEQRPQQQEGVAVVGRPRPRRRRRPARRPARRRPPRASPPRGRSGRRGRRAARARPAAARGAPGGGPGAGPPAARGGPRRPVV